MILLFISKGEIMYALILFFLLVLYALGTYLMCRVENIDKEIRAMSDAELTDNLEIFNKAFIEKGAYWIGVKIRTILTELHHRGWYKKMSSELLMSRFQHLSEVVKPLSFREGFTYRQQLTFIKKEMKRRRLL